MCRCIHLSEVKIHILPKFKIILARKKKSKLTGYVDNSDKSGTTEN